MEVDDRLKKQRLARRYANLFMDWRNLDYPCAPPNLFDNFLSICTSSTTKIFEIAKHHCTLRTQTRASQRKEP